MWSGMWFVDCEKVDSLPSVSFKIQVSKTIQSVYLENVPTSYISPINFKKRYGIEKLWKLH